jgi:hypothetical protein
MILDANLICEEDMGMPNATETDAANHPDLQAAGVGGSGRIWAVSIVTTAPSAGTSIQVKVYDSADDSSFADIFTGDAIAQADATVGKVLACFALPPDVLRHVKMSLVGAGDVSSGKASLFLLHEPVKSM